MRGEREQKTTWSVKLFAVLAILSLTFGLSACRKPRDPQSVLDHATVTFRKGNLSAAAQEAESGYIEFHRLSTDWAWKFRLQEANVLIWRGMSDRALTMLASEPSPPTSGDLALQKLRTESSAYMGLSDLAEAERRLVQAEHLCAETNLPTCVNVTFARGGLEMSRGHFSQAQTLFADTLSIARGHNDLFLQANVLSSLGQSALRQEHFDEAIDWCGSSFRIAKDLGYDDIAQDALGNLGWAHYRLGEFEKAEDEFLQARKQAQASGDIIDGLRWATTLGYIYLDGHDYSAARRSYEDALSLAQQINSRDDVIAALMSLALVSERTGRLDQARDYAGQAIGLVPKDGNRLDILYPLLVKGHVASRTHNYQEAEKIYLEIERDPKSHVYLKWEAEHSLAQLYEDENLPEAVEREYRAALNTFEGARAALHEDTSIPFPANAAGIYDDYIRFLVNKGKTNEALQTAEYQRGRALAEGLGVLQKGTRFKPEDPKAEATARKVGGTILFYWLGEKQSYLWVITPQKTAWFTLPPKSEIDLIAQRYRKALSDQLESLQQTTDDGLKLYRTLIEPASTLIPKNGKVFIIPDGGLNTLNFETLLVPGSAPHYWIEDATITDASSLRLLGASRTTAKRTENVLLFGNAVAANPDYPELRKAAAEMESIEKHFQPIQQKVFAREQATPAAYLASRAEQYSYIHFVAHGIASRMSPLDSAIVMSRSNAQEDSFKLYARDIIHHPLHAQLVTISTCYGAGARAYSGEGLVGLSWAFLRAGAHNVIGALWEVSDVSTPQLMDELYRGLGEGKTPDTALRNAKLTLLKSSSYSKPFYWAPFQLYTGS